LRSKADLKNVLMRIMIILSGLHRLHRQCLIIGFVVWSATVVGWAQDAARVFLKGPYLQGPGTTTMTIKWEADVNATGIVHYGLGGELDQEFQVLAPKPLKAVLPSSSTNLSSTAETTVTRATTTNLVYLYEAALTNLRPGSVYTYSAQTGDLRTPPRKFKTYGEHQGKATFIAYGDARTNPKTHLAVASNFKRYAPDFILHTGDLVADGRRYDVWGREFFGPLAEVIDEIPILPSIGNHEQDGNHYLHYLHLPGKDRWYSCDIGPVHVLALDYHLQGATDEQFMFARQDLMNSKAPWKVVFLHYPVFNIGGHATGWGHTTYLPLFHEAKVDLVLVGHSHIYERFRPIAGSTGADAWPITHITTGGGGAGLTTVYPHPALAACYSTNHFVVLEATTTTLKGRALNINNVVLDSFELKKVNGKLAPECLAQVYPEEALKLTYDVAPSLSASLASVPSADSPAPAMFSVRPVKAVSSPVQIEITLTPESARYYKLESSPLLVTAPAPSEPNKIVWARVGSAAERKAGVDGRGGELLSPALMFQARMAVGKVDTVAYGQRSRVTDSAAEAAKKLEGGK
jgi:acid phosphatase type 7